MKIFCIGLSKTSTTSLTEALNILGFKAVHWRDTRHMIHYTDNGLEIDFDKFDNYDAFADTPIARIYQELDVKYPGSKFILTVRDVSSWAQSFKNQFSRWLDDPFSKILHMELYGTSSYDHEKCVSAFEKHSRDVISYFKGREGDLLVIDIPGGDGWDKLCAFLDRPVPKIEFPKLYTSEERNAKRAAKSNSLFFLLLRKSAQIMGQIKLHLKKLYSS